MTLPHENERFWQSDEVFVATNPQRTAEAEGLAAFACASEATRGLLFFQTSGSEGVPKWVGLSRAAFLASARAVNAHLQATARDRWSIVLPLRHVGGFAILARCSAAGAECFLHRT
ncbi:MAG: AMP-binding protein, partial [Roseimicrobium sp.]